MPLYKIERWDAIIYKNNTFPLPVVRIKPDKLFYDYAKQNDFIVLVTVFNSSSEYDGHSTTAIIEKTKCEPDTFSLTLACGWLGYPPNNGEIIVQGISGPDSINISPTPYTPPQPMNWPTGDPINWLKNNPKDIDNKDCSSNSNSSNSNSSNSNSSNSNSSNSNSSNSSKENFVSSYTSVISFNVILLLIIMLIIFVICIIK